MSSLLTILTVIALGAATHPLPQEAPAGPDYQRLVDESHAIAAGAELRVHHSLGELRLEAWEQETVQLRAVIEAKGTGARELGEQIRIEVSGTSPLVVRTIYPEGTGGKVSFGARLHLRVPHGHRVLIDQSFGDASVTGVQSGLSVRVTSGRLAVEAVKGATDLRGSFGSIDLLQCEGDVRIQSNSGSVKATRVHCDRLMISSSFGNVELKEVQGNVEIDSKSGSVDVRDVEGSIKTRGSFGQHAYENVRGSLDVEGRSTPIRARSVDGAVIIESGSGNVELRDCRGAVDLQVESGQVDAHTLAGPVAIETRFGNARLQAVTGDCRITMQSGTLELRGIGGSVTAKARFGGVRGADIGGDVDISTESGNIRLEGLHYRHPIQDRGTRIRCRATFGTIELTLPTPPSFRLDATTTFGTIKSDFPLEGRTRQLSSEGCRCTLGPGLAEITLETQSGAIRIKAAKPE